MKKLLLLSLIFALVFALPVMADIWDDYFGKGVAVSGVLVGDDTDIAMRIGYVGQAAITTPATTQIQVTATQILGTVSGASPATFTCPAGGNAGEILYTNAACDTLGEICDRINAATATHGFVCVIIDGLRADSVYGTPAAASNVLTAAATPAAIAAGVPIYWDTSARMQSTIALLTPQQRELSWYLGPGQARSLRDDPFKGITTNLLRTTSTASTCTATANRTVTGERVTFDPVTKAGTALSTNVYSSIAVGTATTILDDDWRPLIFGLPGGPGEKLVVRRPCATAYVNALMWAVGVQHVRTP